MRTLHPLHRPRSVAGCILAVFAWGIGACGAPETRAEGSADGSDAGLVFDAGPGNDAGAADAGPAAGDASAPNDAAAAGECSTPVTEATLCLGMASVEPGERAALAVYVLLPEGCPHTTQIHAALVPSGPVGSFVPHTLAPPSSCWSVSPTGDGAGFMYLSMSATSPCPRDLTPGLLTEIELDVDPQAVPGEYVIALENASLGDNLAEPNGGCRGNGAIAGRLTVLP